MLENCILIFGIAVSIALYFIFWMLFIVADGLRGIRDAVSGDNMRSSSIDYWRMACDLALPYNGKKPGLNCHHVFTEEGRVPMYSLRLTEVLPGGALHIMETSESDQLIYVVYEWNLLVENDLKGKQSET